MKKVDREMLHDLYLNGKTSAEIAEILGITKGSVRTLIMRERKVHPYSWPYRNHVDVSRSTPPLMMHLYECEICCMTFAVEDYEEADHSVTICTICHDDEAIRDVGYGRFVDSNLVRKLS